MVVHTSAYHGLRPPKYGWRVTFWAPRGPARLSRPYVGWLFDAEGEPVRQAVRELARASWQPRRPTIEPDPEPEQLALAV